MDDESGDGINPVQRLHLELIRQTFRNEMDGEVIVLTLLDWRDLWDAVLADRLPMPRLHKDPRSRYASIYPQIALLGPLRHGRWAPDLLYILTDAARVDELTRRIRASWEADEVEPVEQEDVELMLSPWAVDDTRVLAVWWD
jgi:hypothetical protein